MCARCFTRPTSVLGMPPPPSPSGRNRSPPVVETSSIVRPECTNGLRSGQAGIALRNIGVSQVTHFKTARVPPSRFFVAASAATEPQHGSAVRIRRLRLRQRRHALRKESSRGTSHRLRSRKRRYRSIQPFLHVSFGLEGASPSRLDYRETLSSKRSRFITFAHAATKSRTNFCSPSELP